jgi:hypothetical protein
MADPITVYDQNHQGHIITIFVAFTSGGAAATEVTITAGYPHFDLSKAHPIICMWQWASELDTVSNSTIFKPSGEIARSDANAPDTAGEYQITAANKVKVLGTDKDGTLMITYWAAGNKAL